MPYDVDLAPPGTNGHITVDLGQPTLAPRRRPRNLSPWVTCDLPGWEGLRLRYVVSTSKAEVDALDNNPAAQAALLVGDLADWDFMEDAQVPSNPDDPTSAPITITRPIPPPIPGNRASWGVAGIDLLVWICREGWQSGLTASITKN